MPALFDQIYAIRECVFKAKPMATWIIDHDVDEFFVPTAFGSLRDLARRAVTDSVLIPWYVFGGSGLQRRPEGLVIETYVSRAPQLVYQGREARANIFGRMNGKALFRSACFSDLLNPHLPLFLPSCKAGEPPAVGCDPGYHLKHYQV